MRVFITGATGLVGTRLVNQLRDRGDDVVALTRRPAVAREKLGCTVVEGDPMQAGPWMDEVAACDAVINLAGANIFGRRWNDEYKALLRDSRVRSTQHVVQALTKSPRTADGRPQVLVSASAIGYYGPHGDEELTEDAAPGADTLARLCVDWEQAARAAEEHGVRVVRLRIGVVLDRAGGALAQMLTPFKLGLGGPVGSGKQWMSWSHHADLVGLLLFALDDSRAQGPLNGTAPHPVTNKEFTKALGRALHRPTLFPIPAFALRLGLGQVAEVLTTGQRVVPKAATDLGYPFKYREIDAALRDVCA